MSNQVERVVVIGGGVIGTACAHYLSDAGLKVDVIERGRFAGGCSHANCGYVSPSHVLPLASPGAIWSTLKTIARPDSPLTIKPRFDPALWSWLYRFARRCNQSDMLEAGRAIHALLASSRKLYEQLVHIEALDAEWETRGLLFVFRSHEGMEHYAETDRLLRSEFGVGATRYDGQALVDLEPALKPGSAGAWHYECDAHLRPDKLLRNWRARLEERGVKIHEQCEFRGFVKNGRGAHAVETSQETLEADAFVVATGAWTPQLARQLQCRIPIQPGKGYSITMPRPNRCPTIPMIFEEHRVAITPMQSGYRIGSTMEFAGYDSRLNERRLGLLRRGAELYLHEPLAEPVVEQWWGWRPMTYDSKPIIGRCPAWDNVYVAAGHSMLGLSMATGTGKLVSELVRSVTPHVDPTPYSVARFG